MLAETLRVTLQGSRPSRACSATALALDQMIYGLLLVLFIIYKPKGILGTGIDWWRRWRGPKAKPVA
jgi:ABC-type branched-subunit amino acid transport system permease subunit